MEVFETTVRTLSTVEQIIRAKSGNRARGVSIYFGDWNRSIGDFCAEHSHSWHRIRNTVYRLPSSLPFTSTVYRPVPIHLFYVRWWGSRTVQALDGT